MSRRLTAVTTTTLLDHRLFELVDEDHGEALEAPHRTGGWVTAGRSSVLVETPYDNLDAILRLEEWDGEPGPEPDDDRGPWDDVVTVGMECSCRNGTIGINQITAGWDDSGFALSRPGRYHVRLACRNGGAAEQAYRDVLATFDEADWNGAACAQATRAIAVKEEYLVRFWPAETD
ncbi:hypothetical protein ACIBSW_31795 [Actinoplanes sp. NPDC049668]|uniref:hypothetical protein n=1 Tax=unclassified Actinoplanes TaxID=2626549 RepID=UPI0033B784EF